MKKLKDQRRDDKPKPEVARPNPQPSAAALRMFPDLADGERS